MTNFQIMFILTLKNASLLKKKCIFFRFNLQLCPIIMFFYKEGIIQSFFILNNKFVIFFRTFLGENFFNSLLLCYKPSLRLSLTYKDISLIKSNTRLLIFSTDIGLLNIFECKKHKIGGNLLFIL